MRNDYNEDFFEKIDSEEKAYWLGFICADGYINKRGNTVGICLDKSDEDHLKKFLRCLKSDENRLNYRTGRFDENYKITEKVTTELYSRKMSKDLSNLGITIDKSKTLGKINVSKDLINHFIRGYFDGDGCVFESFMKSKKEKPYYSPGFTFVGTKEFLTFINKFLPFQIKNLIHDKRTKGSYTLYIRSQKRFKIVEQFLYNNSSIYLDRKKEKCEKIKNKLNSSSEIIPEMGVQLK